MEKSKGKGAGQDSAKNNKRNAKKRKQSLHQPHDSFFKENMGKKEVIVDFLQSYLPEEIAGY
ncbi:MAG: Rpn family recombination-promoting nuclease/putative transposase [Eubacteriales bacterium]|nr:Rpn family recombination-promoting nuclease/putative transposase [Eubacteriales bacterium]